MAYSGGGLIAKLATWLLATSIAGGTGVAGSPAATSTHQCMAYTAAGSPNSMVAHAHALQSSPCAGIS